MKFNNKGFSLVEILIAVVITSVVLGAVLITYTSSLRVFRDVKSISDNIETKTPSIELVSRYFDRWGVGVVSQADKGTTCTSCPAQRKSLTIGTSNGCSDVTFWGNLYGYGLVTRLSEDLSTAHLVSCRLSRNTNQNCYIIWSGNSPINPVVSGNIDPVSLPSSLTNPNADCSNLTSSSFENATTVSELYTSTAGLTKRLQSGDIIHRSPHRIRLFCQQNPSDSNRLWLHVSLTDLSNGFCNDTEINSPIAPVNAFTVTAIPESPLPAGTTCAAGSGGSGCGAVQVNVTFRSHTPNYQGQFDTYTVTRVFGR